MLGVPSDWRGQSAEYLDMYKKADIISPWSVGRLKNIDQAKNYARTTVVEDTNWCKDNGLEFMPVSFPGFGWANLKGKKSFISREDGRFLWAQHHELIKNGSTMIYQAMFDELDESTQIYKVTNNPPVGKSKFDTYEGLPSDHYLWQVGQASRMLRGEIPLTDKVPPREGYPEANKRIASGYKQD